MPAEGQEPVREDITNLKVRVTFDLPFSLYLGDGVYKVVRSGYVASVQIEQIAQAHIDPRLGISEANTEYTRDRYGRLRYSKLTVELPAQVVITRETRRQVDDGELEAGEEVVRLNFTTDELVSRYGRAALLEAVDVGNRLIDVYRHVTDEFHIRRVPFEEIFQAEIQWCYADEILGGTHYVAFGQGMTLRVVGLSDEVLNELHSWLNSEKTVPIFFDLYRDAKDGLDRSEYRRAIIDARTALEVLLDEVLLGYFFSKNTTIECACRILDIPPKGVESLETAVDRARINRKLGHAMKIVLNLDLHDGNPELWQKWLRAKELREKGIHRGRGTNRSEAVDAVNSMGKLIDSIRQALGSVDWLEDEARNENGES